MFVFANSISVFSSVDSSDAEDRQTRRVFVVIPVPSGKNDCASDSVNLRRSGGAHCLGEVDGVVLCDGIRV